MNKMKMTLTASLALVAASATSSIGDGVTSTFNMDTSGTPTFDSTQTNTNTGLDFGNAYTGEMTGVIGEMTSGDLNNTAGATGHWTNTLNGTGDLSLGGYARNENGSNTGLSNLTGGTMNPMLTIAPHASAMQNASNSSLQSHGGLTGAHIRGMAANIGSGRLVGNELNRAGHTGSFTQEPRYTTTTTLTETSTKAGSATSGAVDA